MSNLRKWMLIDVKSSTTRNDSAKFDDLIHALSNLVGKLLTFIHFSTDFRPRVTCSIVIARVILKWYYDQIFTP